MTELQKVHIFAFLAHAITAVYFYYMPLLTMFMVFPVSLVVFHLGHGVFIHRYFTHRHFTFSNKGVILGHIVFIMTNMSRAIIWAGMHIKHHKHSGTENDPHEWRHVGILNAIVSSYGDSFGVDKRVTVRLRKEPFVQFFTRWHYYILAVFLIPFAPIIAMSFWWKQFTTIVVHSEFGDLTKRKENDTSTNIHWLHWLMWGDEKHTDHHNNVGKKDLGNDYIYTLGKIWEKI